ncbi:MAG: hypothetical protein JWR35_1675 [Marmoricola sp.]|nr:hypothetical protein [Marmoricola sp.]
MDDDVQPADRAAAFLDAVRASELFAASEMLLASTKISVPVFGVAGFGPKVFIRFLGLVIQQFPDFTYLAGGRHQGDGEVMDFADVSATQTGGSAPTGRSLAMTVTMIVRYDKGGIREIEADFAAYPVMIALGRMVEPTAEFAVDPEPVHAPVVEPVVASVVEPVVAPVVKPVEAAAPPEEWAAADVAPPTTVKPSRLARLRSGLAGKAATPEQSEESLAPVPLDMAALLRPYAAEGSIAAAYPSALAAPSSTATARVAHPTAVNPLAQLLEIDDDTDDETAADGKRRIAVGRPSLRRLLIVVGALLVAALIGAGMGRLQSSRQDNAKPAPAPHTSLVQPQVHPVQPDPA